jgi:hypothetical protein
MGLRTSINGLVKYSEAGSRGESATAQTVMVRLDRTIHVEAWFSRPRWILRSSRRMTLHLGETAISAVA